MSFIPWPAWPYPPGSDFPLPSLKLSIWGRCPQSLPCLLIVTLSILCFEYLSFIQPLSHQLDLSLWGQQGLVASGTKQAFKNVYRICQRTSLTNILWLPLLRGEDISYFENDGVHIHLQEPPNSPLYSSPKDLLLTGYNKYRSTMQEDPAILTLYQYI